MKQCSKCQEVKPLSEYYARRGDCKQCTVARNNRHKTSKLRDGDVRYTAKDIVAKMKQRTKVAGYTEDVEWTSDEVEKIIDGGKCSVTGIPFETSAAVGIGTKNPFKVSPDRIDSAIGYTKSNTRFVLTIFNLMKNNFEENDVERFILLLHKCSP